MQPRVPNMPVQIPVRIPTQLFRYGESCVPLKCMYVKGAQLERYTWEYKNKEASAFDTAAISWQLFSKSSNDLDQILWRASLYWRFSAGLDVAIGPLTQSTGSIGDQLFPEGRGDMERLAETGNSLPSEEMWRILTQANRIGDTYLFQGKMAYRKNPVMVPTGITCELYLNLDEPLVLEEEFRFRVILHGVFKNVIEIA